MLAGRRRRPIGGEFHWNDSRRPGSAGSRCSPTSCSWCCVVTLKMAGARVLAEDQVVAPVHVRRRPGDGLRQNRVVVEEHAGGAARQPRRAARRVIDDVADPVDRTAGRRLVAHRMRRRVEHHVPHHADVVHAAVDLDRVVVRSSSGSCCRSRSRPAGDPRTRAADRPVRRWRASRPGCRRSRCRCRRGSWRCSCRRRRGRRRRA